MYIASPLACKYDCQLPPGVVMATTQVVLPHDACIYIVLGLLSESNSCRDMLDSPAAKQQPHSFAQVLAVSASHMFIILAQSAPLSWKDGQKQAGYSFLAFVCVAA